MDNVTNFNMRLDVQALKNSFEKIDKMNPEGKLYKDMIILLDKLKYKYPEVLYAISKADIKFLSVLAANRMQEFYDQEYKCYKNKLKEELKK